VHVDEERRAVVSAFVVDRSFQGGLTGRSTATCSGIPGKMLMFMGDEFGQWGEWNHDLSLEWHLTDNSIHAGLQRWCAISIPRTVASLRCTSAMIPPTGSSGSTAAITREHGGVC
jgi:hypothetical protein